MDRDMFHHQGMRHPHRYLSRMIAKGIALDTQVQAYVLDVLPSYATAEIAAIMDGIYKGIVPGDPNQRIECPAVMIYGEKNNTGKVRNTVTAGQHARDGKSG